MSLGQERDNGNSSHSTRNDEQFTEHHTTPVSHGGSLQDVIWVLGARHRRWHTIFREATPKDAIVRLEYFYSLCFPTQKRMEVLRSYAKTEERKARIHQQLATRQEAWKYLFAGYSLADVRAAILREWTVAGVSVYEPHRLPSCECYANCRRKHKVPCQRPRPAAPPILAIAR